MKILITSGGTKIPIDKVRDIETDFQGTEQNITNMSRGTFGSHIAKEALKANMEVIYLVAEGARSPFTMNIDLAKADFSHKCAVDNLSVFNNFYEFCGDYAEKYKEIRYKKFRDYATKLENIIKTEKPDIVLLAAAASDYEAKNVVNGKIRSGNDLTIELEPAPKLIHQIKKWLPSTYLVGFKLLVTATTNELIAAAQKSIQENGCDLVVANDLDTFRSGNQGLILVNAQNSEAWLDSKQNGYNLPKIVIEKILEGVA